MRVIDLRIELDFVHDNSLRNLRSGSVGNQLKRKFQPAHVPVIVKEGLPRHCFTIHRVSAAPFHQQKGLGVERVGGNLAVLVRDLQYIRLPAIHFFRAG